MPLTLAHLGLEAYLDQLYGAGTYRRFLKVAVGPNAWPKTAAAKELGFSRPTLNTYIAKYKEEKKAQ